MASTSVYFYHPNPYVGTLMIDNGLDQAQWGYNLNTQTYPTYGGEVVQILSVNIGDITMGGSITTYRQAQVIYSYFARYFQVATQGTKGTPDSNNYMSYDQLPMTFSYPMRGWRFQIQPKAAPGYRYDVELVNPVWQMTAHIVDTANEGGGLSQIKNAIKDSTAEALMKNGSGNLGNSFNSLTERIGPPKGDPNTDPFQTYNEGDQSAERALGGLADYYASLVNDYENNNYSAITSNLGSKPASTSRRRNTATHTLAQKRTGGA